MTDVMTRLSAANPVREGERPPIDLVWRKLAAADAHNERPRRRPRGRRLLLVAVAAVPVLAVVVIALSLHSGARRQAPRPAVTGRHGSASTLESRAQNAVRAALTGRSGTIAVLDPRSGAIRALASSGGQRLVAPGATIDVVTAAAALDSGRYRPTSRISGRSPLRTDGVQIVNDAGQSLGSLTLGDALSESVNTAFARIGAALGPVTLTTYMRRLGFYSTLGPTQLPASGARVGGRLTVPGSAGAPAAALAAGESEVTATALQMAMVAAAVANDGTLEPPHLRGSAAAAGAARRVMSSQTARALTQLLRQVVAHGTATAANVRGLRIAGKTGTVSTGKQGTSVSFIGFAPADHPTIAIAVLLRDPHGGFGGTVAAPVAARIIGALLDAHAAH